MLIKRRFEEVWIMRLLIAEDEEELARAIQVILENEGYTVDSVHDGQDAYE